MEIQKLILELAEDKMALNFKKKKKTCILHMPENSKSLGLKKRKKDCETDSSTSLSILL